MTTWSKRKTRPNPWADLYITGCSLLAFIILYAPGNLAAIDAFFLAVSGNTESGINTYVEAFRPHRKDLCLYAVTAST